MTYSLIGKDEPGKLVHLSQATRREGTYILGATGTGKSTLLENLILQDITQGRGVCVLDPHGDLITAVLARMHKRLEDVVLIDLASREYVASFHLFHCLDATDPFEVENIVSAFMHVLAKVYDISPLTPQMNQYFLNIAHTLLYNPSSTLLDIPRLLTDDVFRKQLVANVPDPHVRWFWEVFYDQYRRGIERGRDISAVVNKLDEFVKPIMRPWFGDTKNTLTMRHMMDEQKILLVKLKAQWGSLTTLIGSIFIAHILDAAYSRSDTLTKKRKQFHVYADEFQRFASQDFATLFTEARKYGIGLTIAHQVREQVNPSIKATADQSATIIVFRVSSANAKEVAGAFDCSPWPGPPNFIPLRTPVKEPIQFMLKHGIHPLPAVREFTETYAQLLVEGAKQEEDHDREYRSASRRYTISDHSTSYTVVPPSSFDFRMSLQLLNSLFYQAMMAGKEGKSSDDILLDDSFLDLFVRTLTPGGNTYQSTLDRYQAYTRHLNIQVTDHPARMWELQNRLSELPSYQYQHLLPFHKEKEKAKQLLPIVYKRYLFAELEAVRNACVIIEREGEYYPIRHNYGWGDKEHYEIESDESYPSWEEVAQYYCTAFATLWFCIENTLAEKKWWEKQTGKVQYKVELPSYYSYQTRDVVEDIDIWVLKPGIERTWYTERMLQVVLTKRLQGDNAPYEIKEQHRALRHHVPYEAWKKVEIIEGKIYTSEYDLQKATNEISAKVRTEKEIIEGELQLLSLLESSKPVSLSIRANLIDLLRRAMRELATSPVEADSGLMQEIPTEVPSTEVERRIANILTTQLPKYTARVRTDSGEYTITTIKPDEGISEKELHTRIAQIQERNFLKGYLRKRSEVEKEIAARQQIPPAPHQPPAPTPPNNPPAQSPTPRTRALLQGKQCPDCATHNHQTAKFCQGCGKKL